MTKMMKEAIEVLRELPEDRQTTVARAILDYASHDDGPYHLTDEERKEVRSGSAGRNRERRRSRQSLQTYWDIKCGGTAPH
jgi:hypothetical protein